MRALLSLLLIGALVYGFARWRGWIGGEPERAQGDEGASALVPPPAEPMKPGAPPAPAAPLAKTDPAVPELTAAIAALAEGKDVAPYVPALETVAGGQGPVAVGARAVLAAQRGSPLQRWRAVSQLALVDALDPAVHSGLVGQAVAGAKSALREGDASVRYVVVKGDSLEKICKQAKADHSIALTPGMVRWANGLSSDRIRIGQELLLPRPPLRITVSKGRFLLRAFLGDGLLREYRVAIGKENRTPNATFEVEDKLVKPPWVDPVSQKRLHYGEPGYALGTRWIGFKAKDGLTGFGIHGTDDPASIGQAASLGCIRLVNAEVEDLFELVPVGCPVAVGD